MKDLLAYKRDTLKKDNKFVVNKCYRTYFKVTKTSASIAVSRAFISASITSGVLSESGAGGGALYGLQNGTNFNFLGICTAKKVKFNGKRNI